MRVVWPHFDENYQLSVIECDPEWLQDALNGVLFALVTIGPIALVTPRVI